MTKHKSEKVYDILSKQNLFKVLQPQTLEHLAAEVTLHQFQKNQYIFFQGDMAECAYLIFDGEVLLESISPDGGRLSFATLTEAGFFGEFALLDGGCRSTSAVGLTRVNLIRISKSTFTNLLLEHPEFSMQLIQRLIRLMRDADAQMESMQFKTLLQKVAHHLVRENIIQSRADNSIVTTQSNIAVALSASREKVNKAIKGLKNKNLIMTRRGYITLLDVDKMKTVFADI